MEVDNNKIIHIYCLDKCNHHCALCCNKQYDTNEIPVVTCDELRYADTICLTGGEPFLLDNICDFAEKIKTQYKNIKQVYVYTCGDSLYEWLERNHTLHHIDGVNISPKNKYDCECVSKIFANEDYRNQIVGMWSSRIYLFPNVRDRLARLTADLKDYESVKVIDREWQTEFTAASGIFRRLPVLFD